MLARVRAAPIGSGSSLTAAAQNASLFLHSEMLVQLQDHHATTKAIRECANQPARCWLARSSPSPPRRERSLLRRDIGRSVEWLDQVVSRQRYVMLDLNEQRRRWREMNNVMVARNIGTSPAAQADTG
jgi:hypothetical protein